MNAASTHNNVLSEFDKKDKISGHSIFFALFNIDASALDGDDLEHLSWDRELFRCYNVETRKENDSSFRDGMEISNPSNAVKYWEQKITDFANPILRLFFAGAAWEYSVQIKGKRNPECARLAIDATIDAANSNCCEYQMHLINILQFALDLAYQISDTPRKSLIRDIILRLEEENRQSQQASRWGFAYEILISSGKCKDIISTETESKIISELKGRFEAFVSDFTVEKVGINHFSAQLSANYLLDYARKHNDKASQREIIEKLLSFTGSAQFNSSIVLAHHLQGMFSLARTHGFSDIVDRIAPMITAANQAGLSEYKTISVPVDLKQEEIDEWATKYIKNSLEESIKYFVGTHLPTIDKQKYDLDKHFEEFISRKIFPTSISDHKGRAIAVVGTYPEDIDGNLIFETASRLSNEVAAIFRYTAIRKIFNSHNASANDIKSIIMKSPVFEDSRSEIILIGIQHYLSNDFVAAMHILVPQIEEATRHLLELAGGNIYKGVRGGGIQLKTFEDVLKDEIITSIIGDLSYYFRVIFTDQRGMNLRNNLCHGFYPPGMLNYANADLVMYSMMHLAQVSEN